ncbi:DUF943 family protein [Erwinia pyrifoliae]|uniref:DUF943 family protein n=1 Tax=Erwinia pyrifoliae TaxID=79967 RepID=UPI002208866A|nr:DUF943 family protein [Erwinia pyrifoliae]UWS28975.1 DUF943 family protein [Erwinia pyrifoliae]
MQAKSKKIFVALLLLGCALAGYFVWSSLRPVEIIAVHQRNNYSDILVKNFPFTDKEKINWWLKNKEILKDKYNAPEPASDEFFTITFWLFGDGYKEEGKYDRLCFDDMKTTVNCIEKEAVFSVSNSKNSGTRFTVHDGIYRITEKGEIIKVERR